MFRWIVRKCLVKRNLLSPDEILKGYDAVSQLYPYSPPMTLWRAWEFAAYQHYELSEPVLDIGCGDGHFFRLVWPQVNDAVGVDLNAGVVNAARRSGVYREVYAVPAHQLPIQPDSFASAFANCSLEHMDHLPEVLAGISRSLRVGSPFLLSVVTDKFLEWGTLPLLMDGLEQPEQAQRLRAEYSAYHHLANPLSIESWVEHLQAAGFAVEEHVPIVPEITSRVFLFLDHLWHVPRSGQEIGNWLMPFFETLPDFPAAFRDILAGILRMERDWSTSSGAVFCARRK